MTVNARLSGIGISEPGILYTHPSVEFTQNGAKTKKHPVSTSSASVNNLLIRVARREWFNMTSTITKKKGYKSRSLSHLFDKNRNLRLEEWCAL